MPDRARAICWAIAQAKKGDTVLIAGLGEQPYPVAADQGNCYADRDIARGLLYEIAEGEA
jgi:UDP-N-acetylmuramyl tripeptide synthase